MKYYQKVMNGKGRHQVDCDNGRSPAALRETFGVAHSRDPPSIEAPNRELLNHGYFIYAPFV